MKRGGAPRGQLCYECPISATILMALFIGPIRFFFALMVINIRVVTILF